MADLIPTPFEQLLRRVMIEPGHQDTLFDLKKSYWYAGKKALPEVKTGVWFHGQRARTPIGPAAGPQDQMAQNLVLAYLGGSRIFELKTIQIMDELEIGRPCIEAATTGWNIEWSQELKLQESLEEYVKGAMLVRIIQHLDLCELGDEPDDLIWDLSVGYDLKGIQSEPVRRFIEGMLDASEVVEKFRAQIPDEWKELRDLDYPTCLSKSATLSTFHGCPPDEIEKIVDHLIREYQLHTTIKMNPTMLGKEALLHLLHDVMGYTDIQPREEAFTSGLMFDESLEICRRLQTTAREFGVGLGAKFTNTLETVNTVKYMPDDVMYMSGKPLHVISTELLGKFRDAYDAPIEVTFSAGLDAQNTATTLATGVAPATTCTDLLKPGGYGRLVNYLTNWGKAMDEAGVESHAAWVFEAFENGSTIIKEQAESQQATDVQETAKKILSAEKPAEQFATAWANVQDRVNPTTELDSWMVQVMNQIQRANNSDYNKQLKEDDRYFLAKNNKLPRKIDSHLETFDCISCDKCVPVCPNDANFIYFVSPEEIRPVATYVLKAGELQKVNSRDFGVERDHQIGNFADWCNECGNCDTFCPEYDGPYIKKPSFYNTKEAWADDPKHDGFFVSVNGTTELWGRMEGLTHHLVKKGDNSYIWNTSCWHIELDAAGNIGEVAADTGDDEPQSEIDLWEFHVLRKLLEGAQNKQRMNPVNAAFWNELGD